LLRDAEFQKVDARNGWHWRDEVVLVFNIRAVGRYFADVTGWPPGSVGVWLGVFYTFGPAWTSIRLDKRGRAQPAEYDCHMRSHFECNLDQNQRLQSLANPAERRRKDIWWVDPGGGNAEEVASDIAVSLLNKGFPWFSQVCNLETALALVEGEHDCLNKFVRAAFLAYKLGDGQRWRRYDSLAKTEAQRIGHNLKQRT
jgi:hypothetical protein